MKRLVLVIAGFALVFAGLIPLSSARNNQQSNSAIKDNGITVPPSHRKLTLPAQEGDLRTLAGSSQETAKSGVALPHAAQGRDTTEPPQLTNEQIRERRRVMMAGKPRPFVPVAEGAAARVGPINPETSAPSDAIQKGVAPEAPQAGNDATIFRQHDMTSAEAPNGERSVIAEPTTISVGNAVFYTANWFAARSADGGQTFTYVDPYALFPSSGGGFCCDQVTAYAPNQNMAIWGLQYVNTATTGTFRIARAIGSAGIASNSWVYYDFTPQNLGMAANIWLDFPNLSVSSTYLYAASNSYRTSDNLFQGSIVWRIPLTELAAGGTVNFNYFNTSLGSPRLAENSATTMYWASFSTSTQMRIHRWDDGSGTINSDNVNLNAFTYLQRNGTSMTADGRNWAARADSRPLGAYVANGVIGVFWMARDDASFPQPYTIHARFNQSTRALITQSQIWNPTFAWLYPNVTVNSVGNLGGVIAYGGGTGAQVTAYPHAAFWLLDDVAGGTTIGENVSAILGNAGPAGNAWGDYLTVRPHSIYRNTYVAAVFALNGTTPVPRFLWFGRARDKGAKVADFDGDGRTDVSVFRTSAGAWYLQQSTAGFTGVSFGTNGDLAAPGDYDGDGKTDVAVFRPLTGAWYVQRSQLGFFGMFFGQNGDVPASGDFDGDGKTDIAVFRPLTGAWYIQRSQLGFTGLSFGVNGDQPAVGDYDGDGKSDVAVFRPSSGAWYLQRSTLGFTGIGFGLNGDKPTPGDYDGDGITDIAVFRPTAGAWYIQRSQLGFTGIAFGMNGDRPAPGDYDGDGKSDIAVFRPIGGAWYIQRSQLGFIGQFFGVNGDVPAPGAYIQ